MNTKKADKPPADPQHPESNAKAPPLEPEVRAVQERLRRARENTNHRGPLEAKHTSI